MEIASRTPSYKSYAAEFRTTFLSPVQEADSSFEDCLLSTTQRSSSKLKRGKSYKPSTSTGSPPVISEPVTLETSSSSKLKRGKSYNKSSTVSTPVINEPLALETSSSPPKPHPLRSPMRSFFRSNTLPRNHKPRAYSDCDKKSIQCPALSLEGSAWSLEDDCNEVTFQGTSGGTPFDRMSVQPYYQKRPVPSDSLDVPIVHSRSSDPVPSCKSTCYEPKNEFDTSPGEYDHPSAHCNLRRRASSLDCIPSPAMTAIVSKHQQYLSSDTKSSTFSRSTSLSQRSPFRKKIAFVDPESIAGMKELRPRNGKRFKSQIDAMFDAIERRDFSEVKRLAEQREVNINDVNGDEFTPLDIALMNGERDIAQVLFVHGGMENQQFLEPRSRAVHLERLIDTASRKVNEYTTSIVNSVSDSKDNEKQLREWEWRLYMLRIMQNGFLSSDPPKDEPRVTIAPMSDDSIYISIMPSLTSKTDMVSKYKIEWSRDEDFLHVVGEQLVIDMRQLSCTVSGLQKNTKWYVRVCAGNMKGFGPAGFPNPPFAIPSSWHEWADTCPRYLGCVEQLWSLLQQLHSFKMLTSECKTLTLPSPVDLQNFTSSTSPKSNRRKLKTFSKYTNFIFSSAPKLLKRLKSRGIYLAALLYNEEDERVMVTMDDNLPLVEIDDHYPKSFTQEFYWLAKVACSWEDVQQLLQASTAQHCSQSVLIRKKLLQAALVLQSATGVQDLGTLYFQPFKDRDGSLLLLTVNSVKKTLSGARAMTMKWTPLSKLQKKTNSIQDAIVSPDRLLPSIQEQVIYHKRSKTPLARGLYLGYLKVRTAVDSLSIVVPEANPNVLPFVKIRDIPNVTREDWEWIQSCKDTDFMSTTETTAWREISPFETKLKSAAQKMLSTLGITDEQMRRHRLYDKEVIELDKNVLFILILPPGDEVCTPPGQTDIFHQLPGFTSVPLKAFEISNMLTYQPEIMRHYARLSSVLEMETLVHQHAVREAFSPAESNDLKERQSQLNDIQASVDDCWKGARWIVDTIQAAKDRHSIAGFPLRTLWISSGEVPVTVASSGSTKRQAVAPHNGLIPKSGSMFRIHATNEVGLDDDVCTDVSINDDTTVSEAIKQTIIQLSRLYSTVESNPNSVLQPDFAQQLTLVSVAGPRERCLPDDMKLATLQTPTDTGRFCLRLKKEALKTSKWIKTTATLST